jgi:hypothetical protein
MPGDRTSLAVTFSILAEIFSVKISLMKRGVRVTKININVREARDKFQEQAAELLHLQLNRLNPSVIKKVKEQKQKTYNSRYSLVVTHPTTNLPI